MPEPGRLMRAPPFLPPRRDASRAASGSCRVAAGCRGHDGPRRVMWAGPGLLVRRRSCPRRPGSTMTRFCPEPRWAAEMAPHVIDVLQLPGRCAEVAPGAADPGWFLIQGQPPVVVPVLP